MRISETPLTALVRSSRDESGSAGSFIKSSSAAGSRDRNSNSPVEAPRTLHKRPKAGPWAEIDLIFGALSLVRRTSSSRHWSGSWVLPSGSRSDASLTPNCVARVESFC